MIIIIRPDLLISLFTAGRIDLRDAKAFKKSMGYSLVWSVGLQPVEMMTTGNAEIEKISGKKLGSYKSRFYLQADELLNTKLYL